MRSTLGQIPKYVYVLFADPEALDEELARGHVPVAVQQGLRLRVENLPNVSRTAKSACPFAST